MKQIVNWLRLCWVKFIPSVSVRFKETDQPRDSQSDELFEGVVEPPVQRVYYSTPLKTYSAYIDKGRIIKTENRQS
jgi:hypothetical protein